MRIKGGGTYRETNNYFDCFICVPPCQVMPCQGVFAGASTDAPAFLLCPVCLRCRKEVTMLIKYKFANGDVSEVEVDENIGKIIVDSRKKEHANNEKQRYHCYSSDAAFEGKDYATETMESLYETIVENAHIKETFNKLTDIQKERLLLYASGLSAREIARREGTYHKTVLESIYAAKAKFKKFF